MTIHRRFIIQFFTQLILLFLLLVLTSLIVLMIIGFYLSNDEAKNDLTAADSLYLGSHMIKKNGKPAFDAELKKRADEQNGWLLALSKKGKVLAAYHAPESLASAIQTKESTALLLEKDAALSQFKIWELHPMDTQPVILLFGKTNAAQLLLKHLAADIDWAHQQLGLSTATLEALDKQKARIQLIDANKKVLDSAGSLPERSSLETLSDLSENEQYSVAVYKHEPSGLTVTVEAEHHVQSSAGSSIEKKLSSPLLVILVLLFILLLAVSIWYANKFGTPVVVLMKWIENLGNGIYEQPRDLHERPLLLTRKGKLKRKFRLYKELIDTLEELTRTLHDNERQRKKMSQTREEWTSGLSHDLKTPLSSIAGYTNMLQSDQYDWTEEEKKSFIQTISEKSNYMMKLIEDLTLTYRLRNDSLPIVKQPVDLNEFIRRTVIHYINMAEYEPFIFQFEPYPEQLLAPIDPKWFQRVLDNLIMNALKYNPAGTTIQLSVTMIEQELVMITIDDDGIGMDHETLDKLFQRYYRGTNTTDPSSGTGLGMAITKQLIKLHGGSINVKSAPSEGTSIRILLPAKEKEEQHSAG
ncbi:sensor histidine kinase [Pseudobacillus badius]|uniref:sensor histidine kinase n=1 Tax=Bacillus badius TaxID=1455 RepID=UPI0007B0BD2B|nr:HAMP domain-containing sensor histidine kinase [Bacillus badius]KZO01063.1 two-component sensor histidine kinase [Bacillus badius]OCS89115.1 two-component sensor histidine kinase [Bacillus badius]OVE50879.1 sensor histidine kinase [Bacillus badius]TDW01593.1 phospho-acceptor domain-containing protein [Bacillus badius]